MSQHFLHSKEARNLSKTVNGMTEEQAEAFLASARWGSQGEQQTCPSCGSHRRHYRRLKRRRWRCAESACQHEFSVTSGSSFHSHKLSFREIVALVVTFVCGAKGVSILDASRRLGLTPKTIQANFGKVREVLVNTLDLTPMGGIVHVDGGHFGGKPRKANRRLPMPPNALAVRFGKKKPENAEKPWISAGMTRRNWERRAYKRVVIAISQGGNAGKGSQRTIPIVCRRESDDEVLPLVKKFILRDAIVMTDESGAFTRFSALFEHYTVAHSKEFSTSEGVNDNMCETFFSRVRRAEYGTYHGYRPKYLQDYAIEHGWREDVRRIPQAEAVSGLLRKLLREAKSAWWRGYWQGRHRAGELDAEFFLRRAGTRT